MTPLPVVSRELLAEPVAAPPEPPRRSTCARPGCTVTAHGRALHRHHAVSRSAQRAQFGRVHSWLLIGGKMTQVVVDLCPACHERLESGPGGCKSRLRWAGGWAWYDRSTLEASEGRIRWLDPKNDTLWVLKGFATGCYTPPS